MDATPEHLQLDNGSKRRSPGTVNRYLAAVMVAFIDAHNDGSGRGHELGVAIPRAHSLRAKARLERSNKTFSFESRT